MEKRVKEINKELSKNENKIISIAMILQKIISNEKTTIGRLKIFEEICPEVNLLFWYIISFKSRIYIIILIYKKSCTTNYIYIR